jgi:cytochrome c peroxidase
MSAPAVAVATVSFGFLALPTEVRAKEDKVVSSTSLEPLVRASIVELIDHDAEQRDDGTSVAGTLIRLAWHSCGTYQQSDKSGGSNGAKMRFAPEANYGNNAGLDKARALLEPIKAQHPTLSYADLYTLAGVVAVEEAGGPKIPFALGRVDDVDGSQSDPKDRLPNADMGSRKSTLEHIKQVFARMGLTNQEMVALLGAHAMGRCHTDASGFWGPWTNAETTFSNEYFRLLLEERWSPKMTHNGKVWTGTYYGIYAD